MNCTYLEFITNKKNPFFLQEVLGCFLFILISANAEGSSVATFYYLPFFKALTFNHSTDFQSSLNSIIAEVVNILSGTED